MGRFALLLRLLLAVGLAVVLTVAYWLFRIAAPRALDPSDADAIVVLAGGDGERLATAERLLDDGLGDAVLLLSVGNRAWPAADDVVARCDDPGEATVVCVEPVPDSTKGEAATVAAEVDRRDWDRVVLVTSTYHLHRATVWFDRCVDADVLPVAADAPYGRDEVLHEFGALAHASLVDRSCYPGE